MFISAFFLLVIKKIEIYYVYNSLFNKKINQSHSIQGSNSMTNDIIKDNTNDIIKYHLTRAKNYLYNRKYDKALQDLNYIINDENYNNIIALYSRGICYYNLKKFHEAIVDLKIAIDYKHETINSLMACGICYYKLRKFHEAIADFNLILEYKNIPSMKALAYRSMCYANLTLYNEARVDINKMLEKEPENIIALKLRIKANIYLHNIFPLNYDKNIADINKILEKVPEDICCFKFRVEINILFAKYDIALPELYKILEKDPRCTTFNKYITRIIFNSDEYNPNKRCKFF